MNAALTTYGSNGTPYGAPGIAQLLPGIQNLFGAAAPIYGNDTFAMGREADFMNNLGMTAMNANGQDNTLVSQVLQPFINLMMQLCQMQLSYLQGANAAPINNLLDNRENNAHENNLAQNDDLQEGTALGEKIADRAEDNAAAFNTPGLCLQETGKVLREFGIDVNRHPSAYQALPDLQNSDKVKEIKVSKDQLDDLPAGAIVIWDKGANLPHGHISIALGDGREASSKLRDQLELNTEFHVFVPVG